jgi:hypothetical protein
VEAARDGVDIQAEQHVSIGKRRISKFYGRQCRIYVLCAGTTFVLYILQFPGQHLYLEGQGRCKGHGHIRFAQELVISVQQYSVRRFLPQVADSA